MVTTHQSIRGQLGAELIRVRRIGSLMVLYEDLDVTPLTDMPISVVSVLRVFSTVHSLLLGFRLESR
jgi:hypothetical protein